MKFRAIIFDLDGTLINTLRDIADSANNALTRLGFPKHPIEAYKYFVGEGRDVLALHTLPEKHRDTETIAQLITLINQEYDNLWKAHSLPYEGIRELLDELSKREIKMAILSNKAHYYTELMVKKLLFKWHFERISGATHEIVNKPDPGMALKITRELKIDPAQFVFLGDSNIDMKTANSAGMYPVGAIWGFRPAEELIAGGAKLLINHPLELLNLF